MIVVTFYTPPTGAETDIYSLELLENSGFKPIPLPPVKGPTMKSPASYYSAINLGCGSVDQDPIACFLQNNGLERHFIVKRDKLVPIESSRGKNIDNDVTLADGETCSRTGPKDDTSIAVWATDKSGHTRPFITGAALDKASGMTVSTWIKNAQVECGHVGDVDLLSIGEGEHDGAVYVVDHGVPTMAGRGTIVTSGATHALIEWYNQDHARVEYTEVFFHGKK
ncbi:MAG TPA: hypothetical protein VEV38_01045 [Candidatus Eremiobacteraceae bacterium]|nr:hypothetical protein [Candidatus Eremiobacteraceae bacterium]